MITSATTGWDYSASVEKVRGMVVRWSTLTIDLVENLYRAREELAVRKPGKIDVPNGTPNTWARYLDEVGLARTTVHNWLERYIPEEKKLLTVEELETRKEQEARAAKEAAMNERQKLTARVSGYIKTGKKPEGWTDKEEAVYREELAVTKRREEWLAEARKREEAEFERQKKLKESWDKTTSDAQETIRMFESGAFKAAMDRQIEASTKRQAFKERIRVSHEGKDDPFVDAIMDYLDTLDDDNRRVESCYNIIKVCKGIAVQIQAGGKA